MCNYVVNLLYITIVYLWVYLVNVVNSHEMKHTDARNLELNID